MLSIILIILKLIGIILLFILGILLLVICSVLLIPIRYRLNGYFLEDRKDLEISVLWAGIVFRAKAGFRLEDVDQDSEKRLSAYTRGIFYSVRILGLVLLTSEDRKTLLKRFFEWKKHRSEKKRQKKQWKKSKERRWSKQEKISIEKEKEDILEEYSDDIEEFSLDWEEPDEIILPQVVEERIKIEDVDLVAEQQEKKTPPGMLKKKKLKKKAFDQDKGIEDSRERWYNKLNQKIENLMEQYEILSEFYYNNQSQYAMQKMCKLIQKVIRYILPTRCKGELCYGFADPSLTGKVYGFLCTTGLSLRKDVIIVPDFQNEVLEGWIKVRGRLRVIFAVRMAMVIFFDKKLKAVYKEGKGLLGGIRL